MVIFINYYLSKYIMPKTRKSYDNEFKFQVVLETFNPQNTIEKVAKKHNLHTTQVNQWRKVFKENAHLAFNSTPAKQKTPHKDPEKLTQMIGELTIENNILKKALSVWD